MVLFQANEIHFSSSMKAMNKLRQNQSLCDVKLIVGQSTVYAHKCVLAAGSPYFRSLFLGKFTESLLDNINLSAVTDNVEALDLILDFVYTGEIDISSSNLGVLVKLSSFFLVETLRNFCTSFMKDSLSLKTCLQYYLYSLDYGLTDIESKTAQMVQARFHDCLLFEDETLNVSPDELLSLVNANMLDHCSSSKLLKFVADWVGRGLTDSHISMGVELLDVINSKGHSLLVNYTEETEYALQNCHDRIQVILEKLPETLNGRDKFLRRFRQILSKASFQKHLETKNYYLRIPPSPRSKLASETKEKAILCLSPRPYVLEAFEKKKKFRLNEHLQTVSEGDPIMDLFAYIPKTESWHHIQQFTPEEDAINWIADEMLWGLWQMGIFQDELVFLNCILEDMCMYNLKTKTWRYLPFSAQIEELLEASEYCNDFCFTFGCDGTIYLIGKIKVISNDDDEEPRDLNFKGFKFVPSDMTWHTIFQTENLDFPIGERGIPEMHAKVSSTTSELLFTYGQETMKVDESWNLAIIVNLNDTSLDTSCVKIHQSYQNGQMPFRGIHIIEGKNQFYVVSNGTSGGKVQVKYEYKYRSRHLVEVNSSEKLVSVIEPDFHVARNADNDVYPCWSETSTTDYGSLWYLEGNLDKVSSFSEVTLNRSKNPVIKRHPPPPFTCCTALWAGSISSDILTNKNTVSCFPFAL